VRRTCFKKEKLKLLRRVLCTALAIGCLSVSGATQTEEPKPGQNTLSLDERLGTDDGAALAILFGANIRGNLDVCDCNYPRGGLARRVGYIEAFKKKFKETPVVEVEGGVVFFGSMGYPAADLRNEQAARAFSRFTPDVINLGREDLPYAQKLLARDGLNERIQKLPMLKNLISANGVFGPGAVPPPPYVIKEIGGPRIYGGKKKLKIGFVGVAAPTNPGGGIIDATVTNMFETTTRAVLKARKECDVLVIVAHCDLASALRLASENLEADVVIAADSGGIYNPRRVGNTLVVSAAPGNVQEGDLRLYFEKDGQISYKFRSTDLDVLVPVDPAAAAFAEAARAERNSIMR
jgi:2',3'-cyclic-nucleotide 2'-phosphodiesterase (5'-nucleotidase family)